MAETLRWRSNNHTIQCMGWTTRQVRQPLPSAECIAIGLYIYHHHEQTNNSTMECPGHVDAILATPEVLLNDHYQAYCYLSSYLSRMGLPIEASLDIIFAILEEYSTTNNGVEDLRRSQRDLPVLEFTIIINTGMLYYELAEAVARALEDSIEEAGTCNTVPTSKSAIDALHEVIFIDCSDSTEQCVICFENLDMGLQVRRLPCSHMFHGDCITKWLETSHMCPLCRFQMPT